MKCRFLDAESSATPQDILLNRSSIFYTTISGKIQSNDWYSRIRFAFGSV